MVTDDQINAVRQWLLQAASAYHEGLAATQRALEIIGYGDDSAADPQWRPCGTRPEQRADQQAMALFAGLTPKDITRLLLKYSPDYRGEGGTSDGETA